MRRNIVDGGGRGPVAQTRDISGGVHLYAAATPPVTLPRQLLRPVPDFVDRTEETARILDALGSWEGSVDRAGRAAEESQ